MESVAWEGSFKAKGLIVVEYSYGQDGADAVLSLSFLYKHCVSFLPVSSCCCFCGRRFHFRRCR